MIQLRRGSYKLRTVCLHRFADSFFPLGTIPVQHIVGKLRMRRVQWGAFHLTELRVGFLGRKVDRSFKSELVLLPFLK